MFRLFLCLALMLGHVLITAGHELPNGKIERRVQVSVKPDRVLVEYSLAMNAVTLEAELRKCGQKPAETFDTMWQQYQKIILPAIHQHLRLSVDGKSTPLQPIRAEYSGWSHRHLTCLLKADVALTQRPQKLVVTDGNFCDAPGNYRIAMKPRSGVRMKNSTVSPTLTRAKPIVLMALTKPQQQAAARAQGEFALPTEKDRELISWNTKQLSATFFGEGAFFGDFNNDGAVDVVSGPFWYQGPEFSKQLAYRRAKPFKPEGYSDNFLTFVHDFNNDGWDDILIIGWPGYREGYEHVWYENPQGKKGNWPRHEVFKEVDNESPAFGNLVGDSNPELIFHFQGQLGWAAYDPENPTQPWVFHRISENLKLTRYAHGLGFGDVNGDGRPDFVQSRGWWEQPESLDGDPLWKHHAWPFELDGAQMLVYDVDGDGDNDIVTAVASHKYGIAWLEHTKTDEGKIAFKMHRFINEKPEENRYGVKFSQPHALDTADVNGDGLIDFIVGKRFWAHGPKGDPEPNAAAVTYWFELKRGVKGVPGGVDFVPHLIHDDSGVGTQVAAGDLNGDGLPDVIAGNKKGTHIHLQVRTKVTEQKWQASQPKVVH
ncbi:MAG TPA: hypothetical protein DCY79_18690 [Planctomycetaceae bacterium]|nr:hypothetical protein [Blastopirellula sp.]HAY81836.1 hypothetical protein [Planctomycetaceae bacterium]